MCLAASPIGSSPQEPVEVWENQGKLEAWSEPLCSAMSQVRYRSENRPTQP
jgi:hypothetical protein